MASLQALLADAIKSGCINRLAGDTYEVFEPLKVEITAHMIGRAGVDGGSARLVSRLRRGQDVLTIEIPADVPGYIDARFLSLSGLTIIGNDIDGNGLVLRSLGGSCIYAFGLHDIVCEGLGGHGVLFEGNVFEATLRNVSATSCKGYGFCGKHAGNAQVSAISIFGGAFRKNKAGIGLLDGARDVAVYGAHFIENEEEGIKADQGLTLASGCRFENNLVGIDFQNYANVHACSFSTNWRQRAAIEGYITSLLHVSGGGCGQQEYYGPEPSPVKDIDVQGEGRVYLSSDAAVDAPPSITITRAW